MKTINTVTGTISTDKLGTTLMHEHLLVGWAGWELDCNAPRFDRKTALKEAVERLKELKDLGLGTFVDPCPNDIGRDVVFMAEVADASGVNVICSTGLYKEDLGSTPYFKQRSVEEIADVYATELTEGIGEAGIKAALIKCATSKDQITAYEEKCLRAAARASKRTGAPITTHTDDGTMGREQLDIFKSEGVDFSKVVIGHSCGSSDLRYHTDMLDRGTYLGFDRFGLDLSFAAGDGTDQELEAYTYLQGHHPGVEKSGRARAEDHDDDGRESAAVFRGVTVRRTAKSEWVAIALCVGVYRGDRISRMKDSVSKRFPKHPYTALTESAGAALTAIRRPFSSVKSRTVPGFTPSRSLSGFGIVTCPRSATLAFILAPGRTSSCPLNSSLP